MNFVIINNQIIKEDQAFISVGERGFRFGDGAFETCRIVDGIIYNSEAHFARLKSGLEAIKIKIELHDLKNNCQKLIEKNSLKNGLIRIYISRGIGSLGYLPLADIKPLTVIETLEIPKLKASSLKLCLSEITKISIKSLPINYKLAQGLNSILARIEAARQGYFDAVLLNEAGEICEASSANIFWIKNDILYTASEECGILLGTARQKIIDLSPIKIVKVRAKIDELLNADEVFLTNASLGVMAVDQFIEKKYQQKKYSEIFTNLLNEDIKNYVSLAKSA